jgi:heme/copper-type cytochrome/quinol oxidase subunit 3
MNERTREQVVDVSELPTYVYGHRGMIWWGTIGMIAIEATAFGLAIFAYLYIRSRADQWPPSVEAPDLLWGTLNLVVALTSLIPNHWTKHAADKSDRAKVRVGMIICLAFGAALLVIRGFEFSALNCRWDTNAYGSVVWMLLGLHTVHLATDFYDTAVLTVMSFTGPWEGKRFVDVSENAMYWYFVVLAWLPIYGIIYWGSRLL